MGYSEVKCQFCGVGFNIGRTRRPTEPRYKGWQNTADWVGYAQANTETCIEGQCWVIDHEEKSLPSEKAELADMISKQDLDDHDDPSDSSYVMDESEKSEDEYLEFHSDDEACSNSAESDESEAEGATVSQLQDTYALLPKETDTDLTPSRIGLCQSWAFGWCDSRDTYRLRDDQTIDKPNNFLPVRAVYGDMDLSHERKVRDHEHVTSSADCRNSHEYNGNRIEFEEMKDCNVFQAMARRPRNSTPEADDLNYESRYVLTGLCGHMPSTDAGYLPPFSPVRYGRSEAFCNEHVWDPEEDLPMPFHPWCFDVYARLSRRQNGVVDVNGLMDWHFYVDGPRHGRPTYRKDGNVDDEDRPYAWDHHADVRNCSDQWWDHKIGTEYLAANPLFVPKLPALLKLAISSDPEFNSRRSAFDRSHEIQAGSDSFSNLPWELKMQVLSYISSKDIANLRLASRSFGALPNTLWKHLIIREMPWLWEVWCNDETFFWAAVSFGDIARAHVEHKQATKAREEKSTEVHFMNTVIEEEYGNENPGFIDQWKTASEKALGERSSVSHMWRSKADIGPKTLPSDKTNWYLLYTLITRHWAELKGLKNRARIWTDIERMMSMIADSRERGLISSLDGDP